MAPSSENPHDESRIDTAGAALDAADAAVVALHGRGASAAGILQLVAQADHTDGAIAMLAPQAERRTWYPYSFLEPTERNEPHLSGALDLVQESVDQAIAGVGVDHTVLLGFSQGACLASEFLARTGRPWGGLFAFSGGLIGETIESPRYDADLTDIECYLGCSDVDPHIPVERVHETAEILDAAGADVTTDIFEGMGHTVNTEELGHLSRHLESLGA